MRVGKPWSPERRQALRERIRAAGGFWTEERETIAKKMWRDGSTQEAIARALGCTKGQVSGFVYRERLSRTGGMKIFREQLAERGVTPTAVLLSLPDKPASQPPEPIQEPFTAPREPRLWFRFRVYEVNRSQGTCVWIDDFTHEFSAQSCANEAYAMGEDVCRFTYSGSRRRCGVAGRLLSNDEWERASIIADDHSRKIRGF